jgi:hypothetical protein
MKYLYLLFIVPFFAFSTISFGQSSKNKSSNTQEASGLKKTTKISQQPHSVSYPALDNKDGYMGIKAKILEKLISTEIPASLPKYTKEMSAEEYVLLIKSWGKNHQELLKEKYRKKQPNQTK